MPTKLTPQALKRKSEAYFAMCDLKFKPYTYEGLAVFSGIGRTTLRKYRKRSEFKKVVKKIERTIKSHILENGLKGNYNSGMVQFYMKAMEPETFIETQKVNVKSKNKTEVKVASPVTRILEQMRDIGTKRAKEGDE